MAQEANSEKVIELLKSIQDQWVCVDGGWGVDALLGVQTRVHSDLDLIIHQDDVSVIDQALCNQGFTQMSEVDGLVYASNGLFVDLHLVCLDQKSYGHFDLPNGGSWPFPPEAFEATGEIGGFEVRCLSVDAQVQCHAQGYSLKPKDISDMRALQNKYGCVLPLAFYMDGTLTNDT